MNFEAFLAEYRASGGIAENVRLGQGPLGRGLFPIDPHQPATVFTPANLAVPVGEIELRDGKMQARASEVPENAARLFAMYQEHFGWSAGGREEAWQQQTQWHELPADIVAFIESMGVLDHPGRRFVAPSDETCMLNYLQARFFGLNGIPCVVPVIDLVNYASDANPYVSVGGYGVTGTFEQEMLVRYSLADAFALQINYGFTALTSFAYSIGITVSLPNGMQLTAGRTLDGGELRGGVTLPQVERNGNAIWLGHVKLGNLAAPDLPRSIFRAVMQPFIEPSQVDGIFDMIAHFNRTRFIGLLRALRKYDGDLVRSLENAALNQLETLSACVGARNF